MQHSECFFPEQWESKPFSPFSQMSHRHAPQLLPVAPVKTSPWDGLSEIIAVASTVDARSNVRAPEVVICPEGVTVTGNIRSTFIINTRRGGLSCLAVDSPVLNHPKSGSSQISKRPVIPKFGSHLRPVQLERGVKAPFGF